MGAGNLVAKDAERRDGACGLRGEAVAAGAFRLHDKSFRAELAEVVGGLPGAVIALAGHRVNLLSERDHGESLR